MKKLLAFVVLIAITLVTISPALAHERSRTHPTSTHANGGRHYDPARTVVAGAVALGGLMFLDAVLDANVRRTVYQPAPQYYPPQQPIEPAYYTPPPTQCFAEVTGEWKYDRFGTRYWEEYRHPKKIRVPCQ